MPLGPTDDSAGAVSARSELSNQPSGGAGESRPVSPRGHSRRRATTGRPSQVDAVQVRTVHHVEVRDVVRLGFSASVVAVAVALVAAAALWIAAAASGTVDDVESFVTDLGFGDCEVLPGSSGTAGSDGVDEAPTALDVGDGDCPAGQRLVGGFELRPAPVALTLLVGGAVVVALGTAAAALAALVGNTLAELVGGVRVTVSGRAGDRPPRSPGSEPAD